MSVTTTTRYGGSTRTFLGIPKMYVRENFEGWLFILPAVIGVLTFSLFPVVYSLYGSMTKWDAVNLPQWVGIENYVTMFTRDKLFWKVFGNTLYYAFGSIPPRIVLGLALALLVNQKLRGVTWYRTAYFAPVVTNIIAIGIVFAWIYAPDYGLLNVALNAAFGVKGPSWLSDAVWAMPAVIMVETWHQAGYTMVLFLAGLQGIPDVYYEAAMIDGASKWDRFRNITLPLLSPTTFFILIMAFINSFQVFGLIYIMTAGGPANATNVYIYYLYQNAFQYSKMGYAAAMAWVLFAVIGVVTFLQWRMQRLWVFYS